MTLPSAILTWMSFPAGDQYLRRLLVGSAHYMLGPFGVDCDLRRYRSSDTGSLVRVLKPLDRVLKVLVRVLNFWVRVPNVSVRLLRGLSSRGKRR